MTDFNSTRYRKIHGLENFRAFSENDKWADTSISPEDRKQLRYILSIKWTPSIIKEIERIFPDRSEPKDENDNKPKYVVSEKVDGANLGFTVDLEEKKSHYRSRNKILANEKDKKSFFDCGETLRDYEPYLRSTIDQAIEKKLIPKEAVVVTQFSEIIGKGNGSKDRNYFNSKDHSLELVPIDLRYRVEGQGYQSVPHTENWWNVDMEGFKIAQQAPKPLLVTKNLGAALEYIVKSRNTKSTLCDLIEPDECGNAVKEGCILRVFKKDQPDEIYKYVYSSGIAVKKFEKELKDVVANAITHNGSNFDVEEVASEAVTTFIEELKDNPALIQIARKLALEIKENMD